MDPNLFHLDWDRTAEVLAALVVFSLVLERFLALFFEHRWLARKLHKRGVKAPIALVVACLACWFWKFDAVSMIFLRETTSIFGIFITGGVIAGGSKGSLKLFHDVMRVKSSVLTELEEEEHRLADAARAEGTPQAAKAPDGKSGKGGGK